MSLKPTQAFQSFEPENEVKAFIYQQVQVLESLTRELGSLAVLVEREEALVEPDTKIEVEKAKPLKGSAKYAVTFVVAPESLNLQIRVESPDIYEAARLGREEAQRRVAALVNFMGDSDAKGNPMPYKGWLH